MNRPEVPTSTNDEWRFFRHIQKVQDPSLIVSAWQWEYSREALLLNPDCLNWLWSWREANAELIAKALCGSKPEISQLFRDEGKGFRLAPWLISPKFPENSLCAKVVWDHMKRLTKLIPPCGGRDEPNQWLLRRRFYYLEPDEIFSLMNHDHFLEDMGVIERWDRVLFLPIQIDLTKSHDFLLKSADLMLAAIRKEYESQNGPVPVSTQRGKKTETAVKKPELKNLSAKRLLETQKGKKGAWKVAVTKAKKRGIEPYAARASWDRARRKAKKIAESWAKELDDLNDEKWAKPYLAELERVKQRQRGK